MIAVSHSLQFRVKCGSNVVRIVHRIHQVEVCRDAFGRILNRRLALKADNGALNHSEDIKKLPALKIHLMKKIFNTKLCT